MQKLPSDNFSHLLRFSFFNAFIFVFHIFHLNLHLYLYFICICICISHLYISVHCIFIFLMFSVPLIYYICQEFLFPFPKLPTTSLLFWTQKLCFQGLLGIKSDILLHFPVFDVHYTIHAILTHLRQGFIEVTVNLIAKQVRDDVGKLFCEKFPLLPQMHSHIRITHFTNFNR